MLDKQKRYVNGREINVSNNDEEYYKILEEEREKNTTLGYGVVVDLVDSEFYGLCVVAVIVSGNL